MTKIIKVLLVLVWILAVAGVVLPLIPNLEPITNLLAGLRNYLVAGVIVITLIAIAWMVIAKYRNEINDDEKRLNLKVLKNGQSRREREKMFADLQLAEFTLNGEEKPGSITEPLTKKKLLRESLVVTSLSKKEQKQVEKQQLKADQKAAKARAKGIYLVNNQPRQDLVQFKNRKHSWVVWILLIPFLLMAEYGYYYVLDPDYVVNVTVSNLDKYIVVGGYLLAALLFLIILIATLVKRKNVLPAFATAELVIVILNRYATAACHDFGRFNPNDIMGMLTDLHYMLYNIGVLGSIVMLIIFIAHYSKRKYLYLTQEEIRAREEKLIAKEQKVADKMAAKDAKKQEKAKAEEDARLAKEAEEKAAAERAEQERLAKEAAEKAEQERLEKEAAEKAEQERLAKEAEERAEQERLEKEATEKEEALKAELARLAAEEAARKAAKPAKLIKLKAGAKTKVKVWDGLDVNVTAGWVPYLEQEQEKQYYKDLMAFISKAYEANNVYPAKENLFKCFEYTDLSNAKVVILGKLPFYRKDQADGLAYSTKAGSAMNQTTKVIVQEAVNDVGIKNADKGSFVSWAKQGVLLLNSIMTAPTDKPASHSECGWIEFTDGILKTLNEDDRPKVFILWGEHAREKASLITNSKHMVIEAPNPSPLSAANGFYGSKPFSRTNEFLVNNGYEPVNWEL